LKAFEKAFAEKKHIMNNLSEAKATLNETKNLISDYKNAIKHLQSELDSLNKKHPKIADRLDELSEQIPDVKDQIDTLLRKIDRLEDDKNLIDENKTTRVKFKDNGNICHACGRTLTAEELQKYQEKVDVALIENRKALKIKERELEDLEDEKKELQDTEETIGQGADELKEKTTSLAQHEDAETKLQKKIKTLSDDEDAIQKKIKEMSKNEEAFQKYQEKDRLETQLDEKEKSIEQAEKRLETLKGSVIDVEALQMKGEFLDRIIVYMKQRQEEIIDAVRVKFNSTINALYKKMGFKNVEDISITRDYSITVTKKDKGKEIEKFPLIALSASERVTLGVALLVTAKQEYLPDFPFFVIDEIVTSYDPTRFEQIKDFVKNVTDYVIVTQVSKEYGLTVTHEA
jgi:DNA repair exonuclease SbcCD ATPase subunit